MRSGPSLGQLQSIVDRRRSRERNDMIAPVKKHATGSIAVKSWDGAPFLEPPEGPKLVRAHVTETFAGDIEGEGVAEFLQTVRPDGSASFVGVERVTGRICGASGGFVLQDQGTTESSVVSGTWFVVPGSGVGGLAGLRGEGGFVADLGKDGTYTLEYWIE
jgi:hypothetical protein